MCRAIARDEPSCGRDLDSRNTTVLLHFIWNFIGVRLRARIKLMVPLKNLAYSGKNPIVLR